MLSGKRELKNAASLGTLLLALLVGRILAQVDLPGADLAHQIVEDLAERRETNAHC